MRIFGAALILLCLFSSNLSYAATAEPPDPVLEKNATGLEWLQMSMGERMDCILFSMVVLKNNGYAMDKTPNDYYDAVGEKVRLDPGLYSETVTSILASIVKKRERGQNTIGAEMKNTGKIEIYNAATDRVEKVDPVVKSDAEWKKILTPEQYQVTRRKGTERPFSNQCAIPTQGKGVYQCVGCGTDLFAYGNKFESGTGWPSFWEPVSPLNVRLEEDAGLGMRRTEVLCARCDAHLGHVFDDGPPPTGKRYCMNAVALKLAKDSGPAKDAAVKGQVEKAAFAGGCFWGMEKYFSEIDGVISTRVGYTGGTVKDPSYEEVCTGKTGHAEAIEITYDPSRVSYDDLLEFFFNHHDPTTLNRQGPDVGSQYRSAIFYYTPGQEKAAEEAKKLLDHSGVFKKPIVTRIEPADEFYGAEETHQKYLKKNPLGYCSVHLQSKRVSEVLRTARK